VLERVLRLGVGACGLAAGVLVGAGVVGSELAPGARAALAVASVAVGLWGSELLPLPATALLAMALLSATGAVDRTERALIGLSSPVLAFLLGSAALGIAAEASGLADRLAARLVARAGRSGWRVFGDLLLSMPLQVALAPSAMSRNAILVPLYDRVLARLGRPARLSAAVMMALGILGPLASSMLLSGGTSPVAAAQSLGGFTWVSWFVALAPVYGALIVVDAVVLWVMVRPERVVGEVSAIGAPEGPSPPGPLSRARERGNSNGEEVTEDEAGSADRAVAPMREVAALAGAADMGDAVGAAGRRSPALAPSRAERTVAVVTLATSLLWAADAFTGWSPAVPALLATVVLLAPRVGALSWSGFASRAPWATCVVLAGAVSLADALARSGAASWLAGKLFGVLPAPSGAVGAALAVYAVTAVITLAIPNRAAAITLCIPLALAYAAATPLPLTAAGLIVMMAVDAETIYPAQTAANLIAYERGYFGAGLLARYNGATLLLGAAVVVLVALPWWGLVGLPEVRPSG
jgi:di/tricarboxylate transporter